MVLIKIGSKITFLLYNLAKIWPKMAIFCLQNTGIFQFSISEFGIDVNTGIPEFSIGIGTPCLESTSN